MGKSKKGGLSARLRSALIRLEASYETFKATKKDKESWTSTRNGKPHFHPGKTYAEECKRLSEEIERTKNHLNRLKG